MLQPAGAPRLGQQRLDVVLGAVVGPEELEGHLAVQRHLLREVHHAHAALAQRALIDERAQISHAKAVGIRVSDADVDRAIQGIAAENQLTGLELRSRLQKEGVDYDQFRSTIRDRLLLERVRDAEVIPRIQISDADIDHWLADHQFEGTEQTQDLVAHILIALPDNATPAQAQAAQAKAESILAQAKSGVDFDKLARLYSDDATTRDRPRLQVRDHAGDDLDGDRAGGAGGGRVAAAVVQPV